jgi:hypothetical protein
MVANNSSSGVGNHTVMGAQQGTLGCKLLGFSQYTHGIAKDIRKVLMGILNILQW